MFGTTPMRPLAISLSVLLNAGSAVPLRAAELQSRSDDAPLCAPAGASYTRTTLYFGLARPAGTISERQWKAFVRDEVTPRFPKGFTVWQAAGQWQAHDGRINRERAKVLLVVHDNSPSIREALIALVESYKRRFQQESVLWESAAVCAAF